MTDQSVENAMEHFGDAVEKTIEGAATVIDKSMDFAWSLRPVRFAGKTLALLTGAGLMASAVPLEEKGYLKAAKACFIGGGVVIAAQIIELTIWRRN